MIRLSKSSISEIEKKAVSKVLDNEYLGMGDQVRKFEELLSNFFGRPAICVANGTAALHLAALALGWAKGDIILTTPITFLATAPAATLAKVSLALTLPPPLALL